MSNLFVETKSNGQIYPKNNNNIRSLYDHQRKAMAKLYGCLKMLLTERKKYYGSPIEKHCWIRQQILFRNMLIRK